MGFYKPNYLSTFKFDTIRFMGYGVIAEKPRLVYLFIYAFIHSFIHSFIQTTELPTDKHVKRKNDSGVTW